MSDWELGIIPGVEINAIEVKLTCQCGATTTIFHRLGKPQRSIFEAVGKATQAHPWGGRTCNRCQELAAEEEAMQADKELSRTRY